MVLRDVHPPIVSSLTMKLLAYLVALPAVIANTEKTILTTFDTVARSQPNGQLKDLLLDTLTPFDSTLKRSLNVAFPTSERPQGVDSWFLLSNLSEKSRYEIRICWAANVGDMISRPA
jgi:hypothetical protein